MKRPARKAFVLLVGVSVVVIAGCGGQQAPPNVKRSRAIAAENMELRKQLQQSKEEIDKLKQQHAEELKKQARLLEACQQETETWKKKAQQNIRDQVKSVLDVVMEENEKLRAENQQLKALIEELQKEAAQNKDTSK